MAVFKIRYRRTWNVENAPGSSHVDCTLFTSPVPTGAQTWANCGHFVVRVSEFEDMKRSMSGVMFEEDEGNG
jgi:hypothetical protein